MSHFIANIPISQTFDSIFSISKPYSVFLSGIIFLKNKVNFFINGNIIIAPNILNHTANIDKLKTKSDFNHNILSNK
ncbi:MAG: hypothetical protein WCG25_08700 [bacterium]